MAGGLILQDTPHAQTQRAEQESGAFRIPPCQVVIDRHQMHAASGEGIQIEWQSCREGLAFASRHFRHLPLVHGDACHQLGVVRDHAPYFRASAHCHRLAHQQACRLFHHGEGVRQEAVELPLHFPGVCHRG